MRRPSALLSLALAGCATAPVEPAGLFPAELRGLGTEPFWSVTIDGEQLTYDDPEHAARTVRVIRHEESAILVLTGKLASEPVSARVVARPCSDGMSDRAYPYSLIVTIGGRTLRGCAFLPEQAL